MKNLKNILWLIVFVSCVSFTFTHHGWSEYDQTKVLDFKTTVDELLFENPHVLIKAKYKQENNTIFLAPISRMNSRGLTQEMIRKGARVQLVAYPHKTKKGEMRAERIFIEGKKIELR